MSYSTSPTETGRLTVDGRHTLHWEVSGRGSLPLVYLHGGPGGIASPAFRRLFDPAVYTVYYFHQRGAGLSTPGGEIADNTTAHLVQDMEALRDHFGIARWIVAGGSWGSTLGLAYGQAHPDRCLALFLRGIFLARQQDIYWFLSAARDFYPLAWRAFTTFLPEAERNALLAGYARRIFDPDPAVHWPALLAWSAYEGAIAALRPNPRVAMAFEDPDFAYAYGRMNMHYFANDCFLADKPLLDGAAALAGVPGLVVHGRYDLATPYRAAVELCEAWPTARLVTVEAAGHSLLDASMSRAMHAAAAQLPSML